MVETGFGVPLAAGVGEWVGEAAYLVGDASEGVVVVALDDVSVAVCQVYDGAALVVVVVECFAAALSAIAAAALHGDRMVERAGFVCVGGEQVAACVELVDKVAVAA